MFNPIFFREKHCYPIISAMKVRVSPPMMSGEHWHELFLQWTDTWISNDRAWLVHPSSDVKLSIIGRHLPRELQERRGHGRKKKTAKLGFRGICVARIKKMKCSLEGTHICINKDLWKHKPTMMQSLAANHSAASIRCQNNWVGRMACLEVPIRSFLRVSVCSYST